MDDKRLKTELKQCRERIAQLEAERPSDEGMPTRATCELIFELSPGGIAIVSLDGDILFANREASTMLGYPPESVAQLKVDIFIPDPRDKENLLILLRQGHTVRNYEMELTHKNGGTVFINLNARPVEFENTEAALLAFVNTSDLKKTKSDLEEVQTSIEGAALSSTESLEESNEELAVLNMQLIKQNRELEQTQKALSESESRFRALFQNKHTVMLIIDPTTGSLIDANPAAQTYYGYSIAQLRAMNISEINTLSKLEIDNEMRRAKMQKRKYFQFKHKLANGEIRDVEVFSGPVRSMGRQLLYSIIHDITKRKRAVETMRTYERVISSTPDLISVVGSDYRYKLVNDAYLKVFGKERKHIVDRPVADLLGRNFFENKSRPLLDRAFGGETVHAQMPFDTPTRGRIHLHIICHPIKSSDGEIKLVSVISRDVTEIKQNEERLQRYSDRLSLATDAGRVGIWEWDLESDSLHWDAMMLSLYKVEEAQFSATYDAWRSRVHSDDLARAEQEIRTALEENRAFESEFRIVWPDGEVRHLKAAALTQYEDLKPKLMTGVTWDVTRHRRLEEELRSLASTDPLTGAHNRRHFTQTLRAETERSVRYGTALSMLTLDIDHFKDVNDTYGHDAGDVVLQELVAVCQKTLRASDIFCRMGGEEFSAILPEAGIDAARQTAERLRKAVQESEVVADAGTITYTISLGVSEFGGKGDSIEELMRRADRALYRAKESGRNRVEAT